MPNLVRNKSLLTYFYNAIEHGKLAGCYILEGAEGMGKKEVAMKVSASLMCKSPAPDASPCLTCDHCREVMQEGHADVVYLRPEEAGKAITVSAVRQMLEMTHLLPSQGDWRVFIIEHAERLRKESQNALLKSIEEPRPNTVFFLLTEDMTALLPTVRSRAVKLRTQPLPVETIQNELISSGASPEEAAEAALLCGGALGKAKMILGDKDLHQARQTVLSYFQALMDGAGFTKLCQIIPPSSTTRSDLALLLPMFRSALRDLMCRRVSTTEISFFSDLQFLKDLSEIISPTAALNLFDLAGNLENALLQNVNVFSALSGFHLTAQKLTR